MGSYFKQFLLNGAPTFLGQFGAYFVLCLFLLLVSFCGQWKSVWQKSFDLIGWSLWRRVMLPLVFPAKIKCNQLETGGLRIRPCFYSSTEMELSNKNKVHLKDLVFLSEFQKGSQRRLESRKEKKRNEKNLNPQDFVLHSEFQKGIWS